MPKDKNKRSWFEKHFGGGQASPQTDPLEQEIQQLGVSFQGSKDDLDEKTAQTIGTALKQLIKNLKTAKKDSDRNKLRTELERVKTALDQAPRKTTPPAAPPLPGIQPVTPLDGNEQKALLKKLDDAKQRIAALQSYYPRDVGTLYKLSSQARVAAEANDREAELTLGKLITVLEGLEKGKQAHEAVAGVRQPLQQRYDSMQARLETAMKDWPDRFVSIRTHMNDFERAITVTAAAGDKGAKQAEAALQALDKLLLPPTAPGKSEVAVAKRHWEGFAPEGAKQLQLLRTNILSHFASAKDLGEIRGALQPVDEALRQLSSGLGTTLAALSEATDESKRERLATAGLKQVEQYRNGLAKSKLLQTLATNPFGVDADLLKKLNDSLDRVEQNLTA